MWQLVWYMYNGHRHTHKLITTNKKIIRVSRDGSAKIYRNKSSRSILQTTCISIVFIESFPCRVDLICKFSATIASILFASVMHPYFHFFFVLVYNISLLHAWATVPQADIGMVVMYILKATGLRAMEFCTNICRMHGMKESRCNS